MGSWSTFNNFCLFLLNWGSFSCCRNSISSYFFSTCSSSNSSSFSLKESDERLKRETKNQQTSLGDKKRSTISTYDPGNNPIISLQQPSPHPLSCISITSIVSPLLKLKNTSPFEQY